MAYFTEKILNQIELRFKKDDIVDFVIANNLVTYLEIFFGDPNEKHIIKY